MVAVRLQEESWLHVACCVACAVSQCLGDSDGTSEYRTGSHSRDSPNLTQQNLFQENCMSHKKAMASRKKAKVDDAGVVVSNAPVARVVSSIDALFMEETTNTKLRFRSHSHSCDCDSASQTMLRHLVHLSHVWYSWLESLRND